MKSEVLIFSFKRLDLKTSNRFFRSTCMNSCPYMALRPNKIPRLWLWWSPPHQRRVPAIVSLNGEDSGDYWGQENSTESLLAGRYLQECDNVQEVPRGFLAVYVGPELRRFVIPTSYLSTPEFRALMERAAEEFGFDQEGGLQIPCEEEDFEEILGKCSTMRQRKKTKTKINIMNKTKNNNRQVRRN